MSRTYLIHYRPGEAWIPDRPVGAQPLAEHGRHVHGLHLEGRLLLGGPFLDDSGGVAVFEAACEEDARRFVSEDPAVRDRVFRADIRPLYAVDWDAFGEGTTPPFVTENILPVLQATPDVLGSLLGRLPIEQATAQPRSGGWSPREVVEHLLHGERTDWIPRARIIVEEGAERTFEPFERTPPQVDAPIRELLRLFALARRRSVVALRLLELQEADLGREGTHPEFGRVTLRQLLAAWAAHDLGHVRQICRTLAGRLRDEVGPWAAYLPAVRESGGDSAVKGRTRDGEAT